MSVMNRVNKKARGAAPNNMMGMMPQMMMPQMMQMGLPMGPMMGMMQQPAAGEDDHDSEEEESRAMAAVPKANPPTVSSVVSSDVSGDGAQGGLQEDGVTHHQKFPRLTWDRMEEHQQNLSNYGRLRLGCQLSNVLVLKLEVKLL